MRTLRWAAAAVTAIAVAGCGGSDPDGTPSRPQSSGSAVSTSPSGASASPSPTAPTIAVDLTFTGVLAGHVTTATIGPKFSCGTPTFPDLFTLNDLEVELGGRTWAFGISASNYSGPGRMSGNVVVTLANPKNTADGYLSKEVGDAEVVVAADAKSGTATAGLYRDLNDPKPSVQVTGTWHCPS